jgi:hypothetical protein
VIEIFDGAEQLSFEGFAPDTVRADTPRSKVNRWSYSRRSTLEQCPLRYYFQHYGSILRLAKAEPRKERLRFLKKLSNRHLRAGIILHLVIRTYFERLQRGEEWSLERAIRWAREIHRGDLEFSHGYQCGDELPRGPKAPALLMEFYFGLPDAEVLWAESEARLVAALTNFFASPKIEPYRMGGGTPGALVERSLGIRRRGFSAAAKPDLAYTDGDRIAVVDWKMGQAGGDDDGLQLYTYAMGTSQHLGRDLEDVDLYRVGLAADEVTAFAMGAREAARAEAIILQDLEAMDALDGYGREGVAEAFTPCGKPRVCALCPYQEFCPRSDSS